MTTVQAQAELITELRGAIAELRSRNEWLAGQMNQDSATLLRAALDEYMRGPIGGAA